MEKAVLVASIIILGYIFYNYSDFENSGIGYSIIFLCFAAIVFSYYKIKYPSDRHDFLTVEKEINDLENFDGIFRYEEKGFRFVLSEKNEFVKWDDIVEVNSFSIPSGYRNRQTGIEVVTSDRNFEFNQKHIPGIKKLSDQLYRNLPHWNVDSPLVQINNFGLKKNYFVQKARI
ncbi:hypothetical protein K0U91_04420 [Chryseobacterium chendengshani]|uniref:hypothetical protein n=1 Tax=Chryseobacterium sp. LJ668 TaxID=2864040 RepID=UPI001C6909AE|nr:hypothetical protein [Chryseobacterium sp. LJ668]MBW8524657.1 hypothetical protein [Chryseobacterium sp. LJ668]QYK17380.1 hypothetical protein K0U91_04420 [Chryseobacterium sp. LJ668]